MGQAGREPPQPLRGRWLGNRSQANGGPSADAGRAAGEIAVDLVQQWVPRAPMPTARNGGGAGVIDGNIYVAGGRPPRGHDLAVYDQSADAWTVLPDVPTQLVRPELVTNSG